MAFFQPGRVPLIIPRRFGLAGILMTLTPTTRRKTEEEKAESGNTEKLNGVATLRG